MSEWRTIDSAPMDGTKILLFVPCAHNRDARTVVGAWDSNKFAKNPRPYWSHDREYIWGIKHTRKYPPTHWMPLPEPPTDATP